MEPVRGPGGAAGRFLDTIRGGAVDTPFVHLKGQSMIAGEFPPSFTVDGAVKDTGLIAAAMRESGTDATLMDAVACQYGKVSDRGHGGDDMAAVYRAFRSTVEVTAPKLS